MEFSKRHDERFCNSLQNDLFHFKLYEDLMVENNEIKNLIKLLRYIVLFDHVCYCLFVLRVVFIDYI